MSGMRRTITATVLLLLAAATAGARSVKSGSLMVSATVVPYLRSSVIEPDKSIQITRADIENGFIDVAGPVVEVRTNNRRGFVAVVRLATGIVSSVRVTGFSREFEVGAAGAFVTEAVGSISTTRLIQYRLYLGATADPGIYELPVSLSVSQPRS